METCKNCGFDITDEFCPHCGQEKIPGRIGAKNVFVEFRSVFINLESVVFRTIREMILRPGRFIRNYLDGKRKPYIKPFAYFTSMQAVFIVVLHWFSNRIFLTTSTDLKGDELRYVHEGYRLISENINYFNLLMPLYLAFFLRIFTKKKTGINYSEGVIFSLYVCGTLLIVGIVFVPLAVYSNTVWEIRVVINIIYTIFAITQFAGYSKLEGIARGLLITLLSNAVSFAIVAAISIWYLKYISHL